MSHVGEEPDEREFFFVFFLEGGGVEREQVSKESTEQREKERRERERSRMRKRAREMEIEQREKSETRGGKRERSAAPNGAQITKKSKERREGRRQEWERTDRRKKREKWSRKKKGEKT